MKKAIAFLLILMVTFTGCTGPGAGANASEVTSSANEPTGSAAGSEARSPDATIAVTGQLPDPEADKSDTVYIYSMDTEMALTAYGSRRTEALDAAKAEVLRLNDLFSVGVPTSEIALANTEGSVILSEDTEALVRSSLALFETTGGLFDITIYPLMDLWGFTTKDYNVPSPEDLDKALAKVGSDRLSLDENTHTLTLDAGQAIDLGAIAKGYTSARVMAIFREYGIQSAMVSLGGNVQCLGVKPDGSAWRIGIQDPVSGRGETAAKLHIKDQAVITSGSYERFFTDEETGATYHHILDPRTGLSAESGLTSVSVICSDGALADGLSTSLFIMGMDEAFDFWKSGIFDFEALFIDTEGKIYITPGLQDAVYDTPNVTILEK